MGLIHPGGGSLDSGRSMAIVEHRIIAPNDVTVWPGGVITEQCVRHLRVIDMPKATALYVPLTQEQIDGIKEALA